MNGESCLQEDHDKKDKVLKSNREEESYWLGFQIVDDFWKNQTKR